MWRWNNISYYNTKPLFSSSSYSFHLFILSSTVSLEGILRASHGLTHKFTGFYITVERDVTDGKASSSSSSSSYLSSTATTTKSNDDNVGTFHIISHAISKFSELCPNLVTHTNSLAKSDVPVMIFIYYILEMPQISILTPIPHL